MKNTRKGFTLMELLLCIGIIGIVSAMGMTIAKQSTEKAYNLYYYTGFKNLFDVCIDAHQTKNDSDEYNDSTKLLLATHLNEYLGQVNKDGTPKAQINAANFTFTANNGIRYEVLDGLGGNVPYIIEMTIPYKKTTAGSGQVLNFYYYVDNSYTIPYLVQIAPPAGTPNLMTSSTLLPSFLDDGIVGKVTGGTYTPIVYDTYRNNLCRRTGSIVADGRLILDCTGLSEVNTSTHSIKFSDPRNVKYRRG